MGVHWRKLKQIYYSKLEVYKYIRLEISGKGDEVILYIIFRHHNQEGMETTIAEHINIEVLANDNDI
jgi:hypothetical protein